MSKLNYVFSDAEQKYAQAVVMYAKSTSDGFIYADKETTQTVDHDTLLKLCMMGLLVVNYKEAYHYPVYFKDSAGTVTVTIATTIGASDSAILELKSKDDAVG